MSGQVHGKQFEDILKALLYPGAADGGRTQTAKVDVEARYDKILGLETSIKASKNCKTIALADARHFWSINQPFRLLVGCWKQVSSTIKEFYEIHEFIIHGEMMPIMRGSVTAAQIQAFHDGLSLQRFALGQHVAARIWAQAQKAAISKSGPLVSLNPKIDSGTQRRLQGSLTMRRLERLAADHPRIRSDYPNQSVHKNVLGSMLLPNRILSSPRGVS